VHSSILARFPAGAPEGIRIGVRFEPDSVSVLGPRRAVAQIASVRTVVDSIMADTLPHLIDLDTAGLGVTVRPFQVKARFVRLP
jgi:hypothetical protein